MQLKKYTKGGFEMDDNKLLKTLEEEVLKIQNQVNDNREIVLDYNKIKKMQDEILTFNQFFVYGPAEKAVEFNLAGISYAFNEDLPSAIENFKLALQHSYHITIAANLARCYEKQSYFGALNELNEQYQIEQSNEYSFTKDAFLNPEYLDVDRKNQDSDCPSLLGYDFVFEKKNVNNQVQNYSYLIFNVPYVIWKEFHTVFITLLLNENYEYHLDKLIDDADLFLYEVNNKPYIHEQMDPEDIAFYPIAGLEILKEDKNAILNLYKTFIIDYYLKFYNRAYKFEEWTKKDPGIDDYFQQHRESEKAYGYLRSAIYNLKNKHKDPILQLNTEEYQKGIYEYRSFFPHVFPNEAIALGFLESTFEEKLLEKIKNTSLKENLLKEFQESLFAIKSHPSSIYIHIRRSMEITFKYIFEQFNENIKIDKTQITLNDIIKEVTKIMKNKNYLHQPILDIMNSKQREYMSKQKFKDYVHNLKNDANKNIHGSSNLEIDSKKALDLFVKNTAIISILIDEFNL